jgi:rhamnulokinase
MTTQTTVAAVDLGAESGRVAKVTFDGSRLDLDVVNRFPHSPANVGGVLRWDLDTLWTGVRDGLAALGADTSTVASVGVDAWGVDYGLVDADGALLDNPTCYRDHRQVDAYDLALDTIGASRLYAATGVQVMPINTVFALASDARTMPGRLERAATLLMLPDVFHHLLSGTSVTEYSAASTSGCYDMAENRWATSLLDELGVPTHLLPEVVPPGTVVGPLLDDLATGGLRGARVVLPPGHDTASAVVGTPLADPAGLYISSGTWSLVGIEVPQPVITDATQARNITNEGGYAGTIRLLRNVAGLWVLQSCRRDWQAQGRTYSYPELVQLAEAARPLRSLVNPDAPDFLDGQDTPARIQRYCAATGSPVPETPGEIVRCVLDSLALSYRAVVDDLQEVTGQRIPSVNIVGGGSHNRLLSQLTADASGLPVHCGPVEATALGNAATQLVALGELAGLADIREVVAASTPMTTYDPRGGGAWDAAFDHLTTLLRRDRQRRDVSQF